MNARPPYVNWTRYRNFLDRSFQWNSFVVNSLPMHFVHSNLEEHNENLNKNRHINVSFSLLRSVFAARSFVVSFGFCCCYCYCFSTFKICWCCLVWALLADSVHSFILASCMRHSMEYSACTMYCMLCTVCSCSCVWVRIQISYSNFHMN